MRRGPAPVPPMPASLAVACRSCGAAIGARCRTDTGAVLGYVHSPRALAYRNGVRALHPSAGRR